MRRDWVVRAACRSHPDPDLWFATADTAEGVADLEAAKRICDRCPVTDPCLDEELAVEGSTAADRRYGIRGGLDGPERWRSYRRRADPRKRQTTAA